MGVSGAASVLPTEDGPAAALRLLIADDHRELASSLTRWFALDAPGWKIESIHDANAALVAILDNRHDAVLLAWRFGAGLHRSGNLSQGP